MRHNFSSWLEENRAHFADYQPWEVAQVALSCGFKMYEVGPTVSEWVTKSQRRLRLWQSPFFEKWVRAWTYQNGGGE